MRIGIIGAGPTGLGAAYRLNELLSSGKISDKEISVTIFEQEKSAGGLSGSVVDELGFTWDLGCHITYSNDNYYEKATKWAVTEWNKITRNSKVDMNTVFGTEGIELVPYPAQYAVPFFPVNVKEACLSELRKIHLRQNESESKSLSFNDWILANFGETLHHYFFEPYNSKVWATHPRYMNSTWVAARVAKLPLENIEKLCSLDVNTLKSRDFGWGDNAVFDFPKKGGTGTVWTGMAEKLPQEWFRYSSKVTSVKPSEKILTYLDETTGIEEEYQYDVLLSTGPIDQLVKDTRIVPDLHLQHNIVTVVGVSMKAPITPLIHDVTWLYFPDPAVPFYRVGVLSNIGCVTPDSEKFWSLLCECASNVESAETEEAIREKCVGSLIKKSIITKEALISVFSTTILYGYPIPSLERDSELRRAHAALEAVEIYSRGRFGGWKYEVANQDHCFIQGKEFVDRVLLGKSEKIYKTGIETMKG